jgi:repressor LexA
MKELTDRQAQVFQYIVKYRQERGIPPIFREIAGHFGVSMQAVQNIAGFIRKKPSDLGKGPGADIKVPAFTIIN